MRKDPENIGENLPDSAQSPPEQTSGDDSINSTKPCVHNAEHRFDSLSISDEDAEEFLRREIDAAQARVAKRQTPSGAGAGIQASDAAMIGFVTTYIAAHPSPRTVLRRLTQALRDLEADVSAREGTNA